MAKSGKASGESQEKATYLTLIGIFFSLLLVLLPKRNEKKPLDLKPLDLGILGLATYRFGRLASDDLVTKPLREPFTETEQDEYGAGEQTVAEGTGVRKALGELISCPTCIGTWGAALFVYGLRIAPGPTRFFLAILATTGLAEVIDSYIENQRWSGREARKASAPSD